jgi:hypothetical protein
MGSFGEPTFRSIGRAVFTQEIQDFFRSREHAASGTFPTANPQHLSVAVDILQPEREQFATAQTTRIDQNEHRAVFGVRRTFNDSLHVFLAEHMRKPVFPPGTLYSFRQYTAMRYGRKEELERVDDLVLYRNGDNRLQPRSPC